MKSSSFSIIVNSISRVDSFAVDCRCFAGLIADNRLEFSRLLPVTH